MKGGGERIEERGMGNNFTWSNWLRFIIYDLGNNPLRDGKERETAGHGVVRGDWGGGEIPGRRMGRLGEERRSRARRGGEKVYANEKKER